MRRIHLGFHFHGAGNCGDDLMLRGFLDAVRTAGLDARYTCCIPFDAASQRRRFPEVAWLPYTDAARRDAVAACDVWLGLGGAPFQTDCGPWMFEHLAGELASLRALRKPAFLLGVGINDAPAADHEGTRAFLGAVEHVWTRDRLSAQMLSGRIAPDRLEPAADLAHLAVQPARASAGCAACETLVLVIHAEDAAQVDVHVLAEVVLRWPGPVHWYCQDVRELPASERTLHAQLPAEARAKAEEVIPDYAGGSLDDLTRVFASAGVCLSCRYHAALVAARRGWRVAVFPRNLKLDGLAEELELERVASLRDVEAVQRGLQRAAPAPTARIDAAYAAARTACGAFVQRLDAIPPGSLSSA